MSIINFDASQNGGFLSSTLFARDQDLLRMSLKASIIVLSSVSQAISLTQNPNFLLIVNGLLDALPYPGNATDEFEVKIYQLSWSGFTGQTISDLQLTLINTITGGSATGLNYTKTIVPEYPPPEEFAWAEILFEMSMRKTSADRNILSAGGFKLGKYEWTLGPTKFPACISQNIREFGTPSAVRSCIRPRMLSAESEPDGLWQHTGLKIRARSKLPSSIPDFPVGVTAVYQSGIRADVRTTSTIAPCCNIT